MIHEAARGITASGFEIVEPLQDQDGTIGYALHRDRETFILVAKDYAFRELASFMRRLVELSAKSGYYLIFYEDRDRTYTIFDSEYVLTNGNPSHGKSKTRDTDWIEIELARGTDLIEFVKNGGKIESVDGQNGSLEAYL